jgi:hypothetical protein
MTITQTVGSWTVAVDLADSGCTFSADAQIERRVPAAGSARETRSCTIEVRKHGGGLIPRALLSGTFRPRPTQECVVQIPHSGRIGRSEPAACAGLLGHSLVPGLPKEFVEAVTTGITSRSGLLSPGSIEISGAAYDPVDSSAYAFRHAGLLLSWVLLSPSLSAAILSDSLASEIAGWRD